MGKSNHNADFVEKIHGIAFAFFVLIKALLDYWIFPLLPDISWVKILVVALVDIGLYGSLYFLVKLVYNKLIERDDRFRNFNGTWYHVHIPYTLGEVDHTRDILRAGKTVIHRDLYDFSFEGTNFGFSVDDQGNVVCDGHNPTRWNTVISELSTSRETVHDVIQIYKAQTDSRQVVHTNICPCCKQEFGRTLDITEADPSRYGVHKIRMVLDDVGEGAKGQRCDVLECEYSDCWPSLKTGKLLIFRRKADRDAKIKEYFESKNCAK
ncbi:MAG: hypothetical protein J6B54_00755 [Clostridia bacterium]|nr:hypothetical protein [Clostridia bacterium]